jgi:hypothetical protein
MKINFKTWVILFVIFLCFYKVHQNKTYLKETFTTIEAAYQIKKRTDKLKELQKKAETIKLSI